MHADTYVAYLSCRLFQKYLLMEMRETGWHLLEKSVRRTRSSGSSTSPQNRPFSAIRRNSVTRTCPPVTRQMPPWTGTGNSSGEEYVNVNEEVYSSELTGNGNYFVAIWEIGNSNSHCYTRVLQIHLNTPVLYQLRPVTDLWKKTLGGFAVRQEGGGGAGTNM